MATRELPSPELLRQLLNYDPEISLGQTTRLDRSVSGPTKKTGRWLADIGVGGKTIYIGLFSTFEAALATRQKAERRFGFHPNHGT